MNWEKVKGFCRRQKQKFEEQYGHVEVTHDQIAEQAVHRAQTYRSVALSVMNKIQRVINNLSDTVQCLDGISEDLKRIEGGSFELATNRLNMVLLATQKHHDALQQVLATACQKLKSYADEGVSIEHIAEDRKSKKLEFDFFRNKVAALRAHPPADPSRIPRNELRTTEWQKLYEEANDRLKHLTQNLTDAGTLVLGEATNTTAAAITKYYSDCGLSWRSAYGSEPNMSAGSQLKASISQQNTPVAVRSATATAVPQQTQQYAPTAVPQQTQQYAPTAVPQQTQQYAPTPAPAEEAAAHGRTASSSEQFVRPRVNVPGSKDDPFAM